MTDWIRALAVSFAKRCRQEAEMQDQNWFVAHPEVTRYILQHEEAQDLIGRMCAAPLVIRYDERDEIIHTDEHPFCEDPFCGCHDDRDLIKEFCYQPWKDGVLTFRESVRLRRGQQL